jgi:hypothetical protein
LGKEGFEFGVKLRREGLVMRHDEGGTPDVLDDIGHRESLARPGDTEKSLVPVARLDGLGELGDRLGLIAGRLVFAGELESHGGSFQQAWGKVQCAF